MSKKYLIAVVVVLGLLGVLVSGCAKKNESYGQPISITEKTAVSKILANPGGFDKKEVRVEGKILEECPSGGWVMLKDEGAVVLVDMHPSEFSIPQAIGKRIVAQGEVKKEGTRIEIVGKGVQIP